MSWRLSTIIRLLVAIGIGGFVLKHANPSAVADALGRVSIGWLTGTLLLVILDRALMAYRWMALLGADNRPPFFRMLRIFFESSFIGAFLPSVGGDVARAWQLTRDGVAGSRSVASVMMDRLLGVVSILGSAAIGLAVAPSALDDRLLTLSLVGMTGVCVAALVLVFSRSADRLARSWLSWGEPFRVIRALRRLLEALQGYRSQSRALTLVVVASFAVQLLRVLQAWMLGQGLGIVMPFSLYLAYIPIIVLVMMLPVTVSGIGTGNLAFVFLFRQAGVSDADAFALSVLFLALGLAGTLPGGLLYVLRPRRPTVSP